jgi:hypothetical protein
MFVVFGVCKVVYFINYILKKNSAILFYLCKYKAVYFINQMI